MGIKIITLPHPFINAASLSGWVSVLNTILFGWLTISDDLRGFDR